MPSPPTEAVGKGYWTDLEKRQFENGVLKFGWGRWREVSGLIPTRSKAQVKSHAQKFATHRREEYEHLLQKHEVEEKKRAEKAKQQKKEQEQKSNKQLMVVPLPTKKIFRRSSRTSAAARMAATIKSTAPSPVKVRRSSKSSIERADVTPKVATVKAKKLANQATMKPKLGEQIMKMFTKNNSPHKETKLDATGSEMGEKVMHLTISPMRDDAIAALDDHTQVFTKSHTKDKPGVEMKLEDSPFKCKSFDQHEIHVQSNFPVLSVVTPSSSFVSTFEESQEVEELMRSIDFDTFEDDSKDIDEESFVLALANELFDFDLEDEDILSGVSNITDNAYTMEQQIKNPCRSSAFVHLRLQVQPDEHTLDQIIAILESHPSESESACKCTAMRGRILKLAKEVMESGWWRDSPDRLTPYENVQRAHLEYLVALTFAVLQADAWKRSPDVLNAQDDILSICQIIPGIWNRVNKKLLARDGNLFGIGNDQRERSDAVESMVRMFDTIPLQCN